MPDTITIKMLAGLTRTVYLPTSGNPSPTGLTMQAVNL
jgi:hypothetical protein